MGRIETNVVCFQESKDKANNGKKAPTLESSIGSLRSNQRHQNVVCEARVAC